MLTKHISDAQKINLINFSEFLDIHSQIMAQKYTFNIYIDF
jgi:hypothetical protein